MHTAVARMLSYAHRMHTCTHAHTHTVKRDRMCERDRAVVLHPSWYRMVPIGKRDTHTHTLTHDDTADD